MKTVASSPVPQAFAPMTKGLTDRGITPDVKAKIGELFAGIIDLAPDTADELKQFADNAGKLRLTPKLCEALTLAEDSATRMHAKTGDQGWWKAARILRGMKHARQIKPATGIPETK